jgi:hypothetical protein
MAGNALLPRIRPAIGEESEMKPEYTEGPEARKKFDEGMAKLFRAPKTPIKKDRQKQEPKRKKSSKG